MFSPDFPAPHALGQIIPAAQSLSTMRMIPLDSILRVNAVMMAMMKEIGRDGRSGIAKGLVAG
jgi:hypothetical protein